MVPPSVFHSSADGHLLCFPLFPMMETTAVNTGVQTPIPTAAFHAFGYARAVQQGSSHVLPTIETFTEEDTRYKKCCTQDNDASVPFKVGTLGPHTVLLITISCPVMSS